VKRNNVQIHISHVS